jgi:hypothetical protein
MFWNKKSTPLVNDEIRETLFGDMPIEKWRGKDATEEPWILFEHAKEQIEKSQNEQAVEMLTKITQMKNLESRHYAQAYHYLKQLGKTSDQPTELFGVVVEVGMRKNEYDLLAAYTDLSARYYNYTGAGIVWDNPDNSIENEITTVLELGKEVMNNIGPWEEARPKPIKKGMVRLNMLTSKGLHFGEAPMHVMGNDPIGGGLLNASAVLMQKLMEKT